MMLLTLLTINGLFVVVAAFYADGFTHSALDRVPGVIGQSVELRCTKIIRKESDNVPYYGNSCNPSWHDGCYHLWTRENGNTIEKNDRYEMINGSTENFCANFNETSKLAETLLNTDSYNYYSSQNECFYSVLTIKNIQSSDFGTYSCNLSMHEVGKRGSWKRSYDSEIRKIVLYDKEDDKAPLASSTQYMEAFATSYKNDRLLIQCTTIGTQSLSWIAYDTRIKSCNDTGSCVSYSFSIDDITRYPDSWLSLQFHHLSHTPFDGVTESFIYFKNISPLDYLEVNCALSNDGLAANYDNRIKVETLYNIYDDWLYDGYDMFIGPIVVLPVIVLSVTAAAIMACVRARLCCSSKRNQFFAIQPVPGSFS